MLTYVIVHTFMCHLHSTWRKQCIEVGLSFFDRSWWCRMLDRSCACFYFC
uniref:Uncharacterized protein n=1 Tax=Setaria italica TaxID=4555 RepID=K3XPA2_SETIT